MAAWLLLCGGIRLAAQEGFAGRYLTRAFSMEEGLPCDFVDDMLVDDAGFVWIATSGGKPVVVVVAREADWEASPRKATLVYAGTEKSLNATYWGKKVK